MPTLVKSAAFIKNILQANCVYQVAQQSQIHHAPQLSALTGAEVLLKREDQQPIFSFKLRGAFNYMYRLSPAQRKRGVITASAGNHAQGVAYGARHLDIRATIVMPVTTPDIKVQSVRTLGARIILHGDSYDESEAHARKLADKHHHPFIHPFDDPLVIAGQGTIGCELMRQVQEPLDAIFLPVGGGGLAAGVAAYCKTINPGLRIYAVEAEDSACLDLAMRSGRRNALQQVGLFADGVAVKRVGRHTFALLRECIEPEVIKVTVDEICAAVRDGFEDTRTMLEPAGALAIAGLKRYAQERNSNGERLLALTTGANVGLDRLGHIIERANYSSGSEALLAVRLQERPGSLLRFCKVLGNSGISECNYRLSDKRQAIIFVGLNLRQMRLNDRAAIMARLEQHGFPTIDMTDDSTAKLHVRHMVGGRLPASDKCELVLRLRFPERPRALLDFLQTLDPSWNISMFHYRNHGAAYGRVLLGLMIDPGDRPAVFRALKKIGYSAEEETESPSYRLFLGL